MRELFSQRFDKQGNGYIVEYERVNYKKDDDIESIDDVAKALIMGVGFLLLSLFD